MTRYEVTRMLVLNEISDDYEEIGHVRERVVVLCLQCGLPVESADVSRALIDLVKLGWARAYDLSKDPPEESAGVPQLEEVGEYYYWATAQGRDVQGSFGGWPFDDKGAVILGWSPPPE
jgi:hypothetical protein